jgi:hypothetical protein
VVSCLESNPSHILHVLGSILSRWRSVLSFFRGLPQFLQSDAGIVPNTRLWPFHVLPNYSFRNHSPIRRYKTNEVEKALFNKVRNNLKTQLPQIDPY